MECRKQNLHNRDGYQREKEKKNDKRWAAGMGESQTREEEKKKKVTNHS